MKKLYGRGTRALKQKGVPVLTLCSSVYSVVKQSDCLTTEYTEKHRGGHRRHFLFQCTRVQSGFTLVELIIVIALIVVLLSVVVGGLGYSNYWRDEAYVRKLSETIEFLHHQAVVDQAFYRLEIDLGNEKGTHTHSFHVGVLRPEEESDKTLQELCTSETGVLSCELASFLSPSLGSSQTVIPPPDYPSLADKVFAPDGVSFKDVRTMRGKTVAKEGGNPFILFSPRGFSEFAVLHLIMSSGKEITILVNPFSGVTTIYREYKDFEWQYGRKESKMK